MSDARTELTVGARVLTDNGTAVVEALPSGGATFRNCLGDVVEIPFNEFSTLRLIADGEVAALREPLRPLWDALDDATRKITLNRLEIVQEIVTGYRDGHPALKRPGEPRHPFGPGFGVAEYRRCEAMAELLRYAGQFDHALQRRVRDGEIQSAGYSPNTLRTWVREWKKEGLLALIDGRSIRPRNSWNALDERFRVAATKVVDSLDGDRSTVSIDELDRRIRVLLRTDGVTDIDIPQRATRAYLSTLKAEKGATTRAQRSRKLQQVSGTKHYPAIRPGQIVAIDATRADNLVFDPLFGGSMSVEILTAIDVATRTVLALRVVPMSANGIDAGLLLYDVCRPFSLTVKGTSISDWRWVGLPGQVDFTHVNVRAGRRLLAPDFSTLQGEHPIPSVAFDAAHCDHGSAFMSVHFYALLRDLGIDLLVSRGKKPTDNPHVERWHETIQRGLQQIPGYKGRNVSQRGRLVAEEPLLTAQELQEHLRRFIALDYHRTGHTGLILHKEETARICPLELWDAMVEATGRIDVPQQPDLIYQFLPIRWGVIGQAGVELDDMTFDSPVFDDYRRVPKGLFRPGDSAAPFYVDPHDLSRIWFRDLNSNHVVPIEWRGANRTDAPLTKVIVDAARKIVRDRGGNTVLKHGSAGRQILAELGELTAAPATRELRAKLKAGTRRVEQSRMDHSEAEQARDSAAPKTVKKQKPLSPASLRRPWPDLLEEG